MQHIILTINGMTCSGCVNNVSRILQQITGVSSVQVDLATGQTQIQFDESQTQISELIEALEYAGYDAIHSVE